MLISFLFLLPSLKDVGDYLFANHQYNEAIRVYELAYKETPSPELKLKIGLGLYAIGDWDNSVIQLSRVRDSKFKPKADSLLRRIYFRKGVVATKISVGARCTVRLQDALFWFKKARDKYGIGFVHYKLGNKEEARKNFQELGDAYALGVISYQEGRFKEAADYFKEAGREKSSVIGASLYRMREYGEALDYFKEAGNDFFVAECYYRLGEFRESEKWYKKYLAGRGEEPSPLQYKRDALYGLAWTHYRLEDFSSSAKEFSEFITHYPGDDLRYIGMYYAARSFLQIGEPGLSIAYFRELLDEYPDCEFAPNSHYWIGKAYFSQSDYYSCIKELKLLVSCYPSHELCEYAYSMIGNAYQKSGEPDSAIFWYSKVKSPPWLLDEARFKIEECYFEMGEYGARIDVLRNFVTKYPKSPRAPKFMLEIAKYWERENNLREAISTYNDIIAGGCLLTTPSIVQEAKFGLGDCYFKMKKYDAAIDTYRELLNTGLRIRALSKLASTYFSLSQYDRAIHGYECLVNEFPESDEALDAQYKIGLAYESLNKQREARLAFQEFIDKYPEDPKLWDIWIKVARTYFYEGFTSKYEQTLLYIKNQGKGRAQNEANFLLGSLYFDKGDYKGARDFYLLAMAHYKDADSKSSALIGAAHCAKSLGEIEEARELYQKVIALAPSPDLERLAKKEVASLPK